ncbi:HalOD1 output domain-containing protein [Halomarina salina]|uniref:HalOD1 output domain-containing protein n=1 Tax=Halomarina salina TaxID=1872699 RepID=A0ABD5RNI0_9EURY|nr:HalOD1 output domain-containing protein [Halomarina salina]
MDGPASNPSERPLDGDPLSTSEFVPGEGELLTTVVDLIERTRDVDLTHESPLGERVDWDALDHLLDDESRAMNVESVAFSYHDVVVRITGSGSVSLYDDPQASASTSADASDATDSMDLVDSIDETDSTDDG